MNRVFDVLGSAGNETTTVNVIENPSLDIFSHLTTSLTTAFATSDIGAAIQAVNNVAVTANVVNCSAAPITRCLELNRSGCQYVPNTCGSCNDGYIGVPGAHNSPCELVGADVSGIYVNVSKACPSSNVESVCSGHGSCGFFDSSSNSIESCDVQNPYCYTSCECQDGYGGSDCNLNSTILGLRSALRSQLCEAITNISSLQDHSGSGLNILLGSLYSSFEAGEVVTANSHSTCLRTLLHLSRMASLGYLKSAQSTTPRLLVNILSAYSLSSLLSTASSASIANTLISRVSSGILDTLAPGQVKSDFVTDGVQISLQNVRVTEVANSSISPPPSLTASTFGGMNSYVDFASGGLEHCGAQHGYVQVSIAQWTRNPTNNSALVQSPATSLVTSYSSNPLRSRTLSTANVVFYLIQPFNQRFDIVVNETHIRDIRYPNETIPQCRTYDSETGSYSTCSGCDVSSFTNDNATFACSDISLLCSALPLISVNTRELSADDDDSVAGNDDGATADSGSQVLTTNLFGAFLDTIMLTYSTNILALSLVGASEVVGIVGTSSC